jgi:hypothetical protein
MRRLSEILHGDRDVVRGCKVGCPHHSILDMAPRHVEVPSKATEVDIPRDPRFTRDKSLPELRAFSFVREREFDMAS